MPHRQTAVIFYRTSAVEYLFGDTFSGARLVSREFQMSDDEKREFVGKVVEELKHEYLIVHKDQWRVYAIRTVATLFLVSGVTIVAVLGVMWGSATAVTNRELNKLAEQARQTSDEIMAIKNELTQSPIPKLQVERLEIFKKENGRVVGVWAPGHLNASQIVLTTGDSDTTPTRELAIGVPINDELGVVVRHDGDLMRQFGKE
jgi:hypothetical protein